MAVLGLALPLLHVTAAYALSFTTSFAPLFAYLARREQGSVSTRVHTALACALLTSTCTCIARQPLVDLLVPTSVRAGIEMAFGHHLGDELRSFYNGNAPTWMLMEVKRWRDHFTASNSASLLRALIGLAASIATLSLRKRPPLADVTLSIAGAVIVANVAIILTDSYPMFEHLLPLAAIDYVLALLALATLRQADILSGRHIESRDHYGSGRLIYSRHSHRSA